MLTRLQIRDFAIIDQASVEFAPGMSVLTGETGAGKSILVDALGLVLGERGGTGLVRPGSTRAEFTAEFDLADLDRARAWLVDQALDADGECILRRVIGDDGRSRAFINGNAVTLQSLKALGDRLLDIHGQHFHQSLGQRSVQRELLDHFGGLMADRASVERCHAEWQSLERQLHAIESAHADRDARLDLLRFQTAELEALQLLPGEFAELQAERRRLQNSGRLADAIANAMQAIYDGEHGNAQSLVADALQSIQSVLDYDSGLAEARQMLDEAGIQISEAHDSLRRYAESLDMDPARRDAVEERLDAIQSLARKHRVDADDLHGLLGRLSEQLRSLETAGAHSEELGKQARAAERLYRDAAEDLSAKRRAAAAGFAAAVSAAMADLGMPGGVFELRLTRAAEPRASGIDEVEYLLSANPGQAPMPLARVASGGELSRMSLAIQVIASDGSVIPTMVFDEVDAGVGGGVAEMVGRRLRELGRSRQVLCVTHLPQVAGLADNHYRVVKISDGKSTRTAINRLNDGERVEELARMLGGVKITRKTREHAAEMLKMAARRPDRSKAG